jgi:ribonuclease BN (tRNA processing enzyme)
MKPASGASGAKGGPSRGHITVICDGANGTGLSMMVGVDNEHISELLSASPLQESCLLNAGDSCQLLAASMKLKLKTVRYIFLTSLAPHCSSGIPSVLLSMSDMVCMISQLA